MHGLAWFVGDKATMKQVEQSGKLKTLHEDGRSVLDWAKIGGYKEVITFLQAAGAK